MFIFSFDCESVGLGGNVFAVAYVVMNDRREILDSNCWSIGVADARRPMDSPEDIEWLRANIPAEIFEPKGKISLSEMKEHFLVAAQRWKDRGAEFVVDCGFPIEARWLREVGFTPYPLHEVATALLMRGKDPTATYERKENELPKHHPLADSIQSARLFLECL